VLRLQSWTRRRTTHVGERSDSRRSSSCPVTHHQLRQLASETRVARAASGRLSTSLSARLAPDPFAVCRSRMQLTYSFRRLDAKLVNLLDPNTGVRQTRCNLKYFMRQMALQRVPRGMHLKQLTMQNSPATQHQLDMRTCPDQDFTYQGLERLSPATACSSPPV
jgi:hypothetical protein